MADSSGDSMVCYGHCISQISFSASGHKTVPQHCAIYGREKKQNGGSGEWPCGRDGAGEPGDSERVPRRDGVGRPGGYKEKEPLWENGCETGAPDPGYFGSAEKEKSEESVRACSIQKSKMFRLAVKA